MVLRELAVVKTPRDRHQNPAESENVEYRSPTRARNQKDHEGGRKCRAQTRARVLESLSEGALIERQPAEQRARSGRPRRRFAHAEKPARNRQRCRAERTARGRREDRPPHDRRGQHDSRPEAVRQPAAGNLEERVSPVERRDAPAHGDFVQVKIAHDDGRRASHARAVQEHHQSDHEAQYQHTITRAARAHAALDALRRGGITLRRSLLCVLHHGVCQDYHAHIESAIPKRNRASVPTGQGTLVAINVMNCTFALSSRFEGGTDLTPLETVKRDKPCRHTYRQRLEVSSLRAAGPGSKLPGLFAVRVGRPMDWKVASMI